MQLNVRSSGCLALVLACGGCTSLGVAQPMSWIGGSGLWHSSANWDTGNIPNAPGESAFFVALGAYSVDATGSIDLFSIAITNPDVNVRFISDGGSLRLHGSGPSLLNNGRIYVNYGEGPAGSRIQFISSATIDGSGEMHLQAHPANLDTAYLYYFSGSEVVTQGPLHAIRGTGRIYVAMNNQGQILADVSGRTLQLLAYAKSNAGELAAINGATLSIATQVTQSGAGHILAGGPGSVVQLQGATIVGGELQGLSGGRIEVTSGTSVQSVHMQGAIDVPSGSSLRSSTALSNFGQLRINPSAGTSATYLQFLSSQTLGGTGEVILNAAATNLDTAYLHYFSGSEVLTQSAGHTIRGTGSIHVALDNSGSVVADQPGRVLRLLSYAKTNRSLIAATQGGLLDVNCTLTQTPGAALSASGLGSRVRLSGASVTGGQIAAGVGAIAEIIGNSSVVGVSATGNLLVHPATVLSVSASLDNQGLITVNPSQSTSVAYMQCSSSLPVQGTGTIRLNANPANLDTAYLHYFSGAEVLTQHAGHTIAGTGSIHVGLTNLGLVTADQAGATLRLLSYAKTNRAVMSATGGGILGINTTIHQDPGAALAATGDGSVVRLSGGVINGGAINASDGGLIQFIGSNTINSVRLTGPSTLLNSGVLACSGTLVNDGELLINAQQGTSGTYLQCLSSIGLSGSGTIRLNAHPSNLDTAYLIYFSGGESLTQAATHTIRGAGSIYVAMDNHGTIAADRAGVPLRLLAAAKHNRASMRALSGGFLDINTTISQVSGASILAEGAGSRVRCSSANIVGGTLGGIGGAVAQFTGGTTLNGAHLIGELESNSGVTIQCTGGIVNDARLIVNAQQGPSGTPLQLLSSQTFSGSGRIVLNAQPANLGTAYIIYFSGGEVLTNAAGHTLAGRGEIYPYLANSGTLSPGSDEAPIGLLRFPTGRWLQLESQSRVEIELANASLADAITGAAVISLDGTLAVSTRDGFTGSPGDFWDIIVGSSVSGAFSQVELPEPDHGIAYRLVQLSNRIRIEAFCFADANEDGGIDGQDVDAFFTLWEAGESAADVNNDGGVDGSDVSAFFDLWEGGGC